MQDRRVVITGVGAITPIGQTREGLWEGAQREESAVRRITRFDPSPFRSQIAAQVDDFDPLEYLPARKASRLDRYSQFAIVTALQAVEDAGLKPECEDGERMGIYMGSALGGVGYAEDQHRLYLEQGLRSVSMTLALSVFGGASSSNIAMELGINGPQLANTNSCASGTLSVGEAFRTVRAGMADVMLAGGVEAPLAPLTYGAFSLIRAMSTRNDDARTASRPFERERDGFVMGEGGAVLVLEELGHALRRDARIYGEILGYGITGDAHHMTAPLPTGVQAARSMTLALQDAECLPEEIEYISAHGSSTPLGDAAETLAIKSALGERAPRVPASSTKAMHGHALGATGAWELAICLLSFAQDYLPPTINLCSPDPRCDLDYIPNTGRRAHVSRIISNSFGFGGINTALVLGRYEQ
ncbi:MAG: beta-ketoacyl-ACP synthase II [Chloroflexota bacterium]|nr:beta-ketoacyl-ACP synthase II [Chloroflexota bacterium]